MRKIQLAIFVLLLFILNAKCSDKNTSDPVTNKIEFEGITTTDHSGQYTGFYDSLDWRLDDSWQGVEKELFTDFELYNYDCLDSSNIQIVGYPNPIIYVEFTLNFEKESTTRVDIRIVNQNFDKLGSYDSIYDQRIGMNFQDIITENDSIFRVYYRFVTDNNCSYIGHGDIRIK